MKYTIIISFMLLLSMASCKVSKNMLGTYKSIAEHIGSTTIELDSLNRFKYTADGHMLNIFSRGKWWTSKDTLLLQSDEDVTKMNGRVTEQINTLQQGIVLTICNFSGERYSGIPVIINVTDTLYSDTAGKIKLQTPVNSLFVKPDGNYDFFYTKKNTGSNNFIVSIEPLDNTNKYFALKKILIRKRKLIDKKIVFIKQ